jgi:hypothetical protein
MKTIPELAEDLRAHINTDNAAKRLIVEHILPLIGMNFDSVEAALGAGDRIDDLLSDIGYARTDLKGTARGLDEIRTDLMNDGGDPEIGRKLNEISYEITSTINAYLLP